MRGAIKDGPAVASARTCRSNERKRERAHALPLVGFLFAISRACVFPAIKAKRGIAPSWR
ncbi:hypothetical protein WS71_23955 [Burkholderia mayonis]|uniref:Uncharacterized protein n=1 Tax=Burkholderia mayonis TaxID=1385591 RepID=A0A1B4G2Y6_9BURK|nr:hypothetical protein WS71_23955 [Burkholderia mayonis]KVE53746.1 hypothetical protein WS71_06810 [Burkholderia mayonis]